MTTYTMTPDEIEAYQIFRELLNATEFIPLISVLDAQVLEELKQKPISA